MAAPPFCAMTGVTLVNGVPTGGVEWSIEITALPSGIAAGYDVQAYQAGRSGLGGVIGSGSPAAVNLPQGATYTFQIGNGPPLEDQLVPLLSTAPLPSILG